MLASLAPDVFGERREGSGPPIVLLHGWGRSHRDFARFVDHPAIAGRAVVAIDLPGFGASPPPATAVGTRTYAERIEPAVRALGAPAILVGHSRGGAVAVCLAARWPELVAGVVASGAPLLRPATATRPPWTYRLLRAATARHLVPATVLDRRRERTGSADYRAASGVMRDVLVTMVNESFDTELGELRCPIELVWGALDDAVAPSVAVDAVAIVERAGLTTAHVTILDGVGHDTVAAAPSALVTAIEVLS